jgi:cardiolipin synthase
MFIAFVVIASLALVLLLWRLLLALFKQGLPYRTDGFKPGDLASDDYLQFLAAISNAPTRPHTKIVVLKNGDEIYSTELAAIDSAEFSINLESYEFLEGSVTRRFLEAMAARARAGVKVKLVIDAVGSFGTHDDYFQDLRSAGGRVVWYHPIHWNSWPNINNRTHRKLLIVDGKVGFCGGVDWADEWLIAKNGAPAWRDTMFRVEGKAVADLQAIFAENWLQSCGDILTGADQFPPLGANGDAIALVVNSTPHAGQARARILFQVLLDSAHQSIDITTPYFLPDPAASRAMVGAVQRGVRVRVIAAGRRIDHPFVRHLSHALEGPLLKSGVEIYDYEAAMIHAKIMTIDGLWSVVGSTNFDHRSFGLNDEVNIAALNADLAARLSQDFVADLRHSKRLSYQHWLERPITTRFLDFFIGLLQREE